jgi:translocation protein SEC63
MSPTELENTAPRITSDFKPEHADLVEAQKRKRLRKERRIKRIITVIVGYVVMAWMVYLILVTARTVAKLYDPYEILGVSRVRYVEFRAQRYWQLLQLPRSPDTAKDLSN